MSAIIRVGWKDNKGKLHSSKKFECDIVPNVGDKVEFNLEADFLLEQKSTGFGHVSSRTFTLGSGEVLLWLEDVDIK